MARARTRRVHLSRPCDCGSSDSTTTLIPVIIVRRDHAFSTQLAEQRSGSWLVGTCPWCWMSSKRGGSSFREIVRQQWNFSPPEAIREVENYQVELSNVTTLELSIVPNTSGGPARASLKSLRSF